MSSVVSLEAYRVALFRGSRGRPVFEATDIPFHDRQYDQARLERWAATYVLGKRGAL